MEERILEYTFKNIDGKIIKIKESYLDYVALTLRIQQIQKWDLMTLKVYSGEGEELDLEEVLDFY